MGGLAHLNAHPGGHPQNVAELADSTDFDVLEGYETFASDARTVGISVFEIYAVFVVFWLVKKIWEKTPVNNSCETKNAFRPSTHRSIQRSAI